MKLIQYALDGSNYTNEKGEKLYRVMNGDSVQLDVIVKADLIIVIERLSIKHYSYEWADLTKALFKLKLIDSKTAIDCTTPMKLIMFEKDLNEFRSILPEWY